MLVPGLLQSQITNVIARARRQVLEAGTADEEVGVVLLQGAVEPRVDRTDGALEIGVDRAPDRTRRSQQQIGVGCTRIELLADIYGQAFHPECAPERLAVAEELSVVDVKQLMVKKRSLRARCKESGHDIRAKHQ